MQDTHNVKFRPFLSQLIADAVNCNEYHSLVFSVV